MELSQSVEPGKSPLCEYIEDGQLMLEDGKSIPVASGICDKHRLIADDQDLRVCDGYVGGHKVRVLRDAGCSSAAVRRDLITTNQLTGKEHVCFLIDGMIRQFPLAKISVDTPFFTGKVEVICLKKPLYDLVIGNIPGVRSKPAENWYMREDNKVEISAVTTRAQAEREEKPLKPLKTPTGAVHEISTDDLMEAQAEDPVLKELWELARKGEDMRTRGQQRYRMQVKRGLLYRVYDQPKGNSTVEVRQVVVPTKFKGKIMALAHESIVGGHLGAKKTMDRIITSFHWLGIISDITRFCHSCDICQKTIPKGKVAKVPLGEVPLMEEPFYRVAVNLTGPTAPVCDKGNRYILTIVDYATRYPEAIALPKIETERVVEALLEIFCHVGLLKEVLSDRGTQFISELMQGVCKLVSIKQLFTTTYNKSAMGFVKE